MGVVAACVRQPEPGSFAAAPGAARPAFQVFAIDPCLNEAGFALSDPVDPLDVDRGGETLAVATRRRSDPAPDWSQPVARAGGGGRVGVAARPDVAHKPLALPPPLPPPPSNNYFARHWRGELSLPKSYWVNGVVFGFIVGVAVVSVGFGVNRSGEAQPVVWFATLIGTWVVIALFTMWQTVGVWRSATRYKAGGNRFWGGLAKTVTVLGVINLAYNCLFVGTAQLAGIWEIIDGDARVGPHQFKVLATARCWNSPAASPSVSPMSSTASCRRWAMCAR